MTSAVNRQWLLAKRPQGMPRITDYARQEGPVPQPGDGQVLVRVLYAMMDPAIRGFMNDGGNYAAPIPLGEPVKGMILGKVVRANNASRHEGDIVFGFGAWSDYVVGPSEQFHPVPTNFGYDLPAYTHVLGAIGLTAYYGLIDIAKIAPGDRVLVSSASGAVGSLVGQMARIKGAARVVGIAGGAEKCARAVEKYGYDECIDYKAVPDLSRAIGEALPNGFNIYFDSVGGAVLEAALNNLAKNARIALCGMISGYSTPQPGPSNLWNLVVNTALIQAFRVTDILPQHMRTTRMLVEIDSWIRQGRLVYGVDVREGFDVIPESFNCLFTGQHRDRLVVKIADA